MSHEMCFYAERALMNRNEIFRRVNCSMLKDAFLFNGIGLFIGLIRKTLILLIFN